MSVAVMPPKAAMPVPSGAAVLTATSPAHPPDGCGIAAPVGPEFPWSTTDLMAPSGGRASTGNEG